MVTTVLEHRALATLAAEVMGGQRTPRMADSGRLSQRGRRRGDHGNRGPPGPGYLTLVEVFTGVGIIVGEGLASTAVSMSGVALGSSHREPCSVPGVAGQHFHGGGHLGIVVHYLCFLSVNSFPAAPAAASHLQVVDPQDAFLAHPAPGAYIAISSRHVLVQLLTPQFRRRHDSPLFSAVLRQFPWTRRDNSNSWSRQPRPVPNRAFRSRRSRN